MPTEGTNDKGSVIYEIDNLTFKKLRSSVTYQTSSIRWRISGPKTPKYDSQGNEIDKGVTKYQIVLPNKKSITSYTKFKIISSKFTTILQNLIYINIQSKLRLYELSYRIRKTTITI